MQPLTKMKISACILLLILTANLSVNYWSYRRIINARVETDAIFKKGIADLDAKGKELLALHDAALKLRDQAVTYSNDATRRYNAVTVMQKKQALADEHAIKLCTTGSGM